MSKRQLFYVTGCLLAILSFVNSFVSTIVGTLLITLSIIAIICVIVYKSDSKFWNSVSDNKGSDNGLLRVLPDIKLIAQKVNITSALVCLVLGCIAVSGLHIMFMQKVALEFIEFLKF